MRSRASIGLFGDVLLGRTSVWRPGLPGVTGLGRFGLRERPSPIRALSTASAVGCRAAVQVRDQLVDPLDDLLAVRLGVQYVDDLGEVLLETGELGILRISHLNEQIRQVLGVGALAVRGGLLVGGLRPGDQHGSEEHGSDNLSHGNGTIIVESASRFHSQTKCGMNSCNSRLCTRPLSRMATAPYYR